MSINVTNIDYQGRLYAECGDGEFHDYAGEVSLKCKVSEDSKNKRIKGFYILR